jgi:hypothetical protein
MRKPNRGVGPQKLDNSYLAAPVINTAIDLLDALVVSQKVYEARKLRLDNFAKKFPDSLMLAQLDYELIADTNLFNLAEKMIENTQYVEGKLQDEFNYLKDWLLKEQQQNILLFEENVKLKYHLKKAS